MRVLAIRAGALGDTIVTLPAIAALSARGDAVELVGTLPYAELAEDLVARVHSIDRARFRAFFDEDADDGDLLAFLESFDLVIAWSRLPLLGAKLDRLGIGHIESPPLPPGGVHASDHLFHALEPLGIRGPAPAPEIRVEPSDPEVARARVKSVALHPSSGSPRKNWARFEALARLALGEGHRVMWVQGEADAAVVGPLARAVPAPVVSGLSPTELAACLSTVRLYVGNDSGVSHLAAAVGVPTLAIFLTTDPAQWAPRGPAVRVVEGSGASPEAVWGFACDLMNSR